MAISTYHSVVATGYSSGIICVRDPCLNRYIQLWDFESAKLEATLHDHDADIASLSFVEPYACLVSTSSDGVICLWGLKQDLQHRYSAFTKFQYSFNLEKTNISTSNYFIRLEAESKSNKVAIGDDRGNIQVMVLDSIFQKHKVPKSSNVPQTLNSYYPKRKYY